MKKYRLPWLILVIILLILSGPGLQTAMIVNNSLNIWFNGNSSELKTYQLFQEQFGSDEQILIMLELEGGSIKEQEAKRLQALHNKLLALEEVATVLSPADLALPERRLTGLIFKQFLSNRPERQAKLLKRFPMVSKQLFSPDMKACKMIVQLNAELDIDAERGNMVTQIKKVVAKEWGKEQFAVGGISVVFAALNQLTEEQFGLFVPLMYATMLLFMLVLSRSWRVCLIAFLTMGTATTICLGLYGWIGHQLNLMTVLIPMVILLLSSLDLMHLLYVWKRDPNNGLSQAVKKVWKPTLITTLTTMLGFLSLLSSPMAILQQFGLYSAIGVGLCLPLTYLFASWLWPKKSAQRTGANKNNSRAQKWQAWLERNRVGIAIGFGVSLVLFILGITKLESDTYTLGYLPQTNQAVLDHEKIQSTFGSYIPLELLLNSKEGNSLKDSTHFSQVLALTDKLEDAGFTPQLGLPQVVKFTAKQLGAKTSSEIAAKTPQSFALLQKHFGKWANTYYHEATGTARVTIFGSMMTAGELGEHIEELQNIGSGFPIEIKPAGYLPLYAQLVPAATRSQTISLITAALLIGLLLWLYLRSFRQMIVVLATQIFPLAGMFGLMGWFGIELDVATASIASIALSFCVDDSIHFSSGYRRHRKNGLDHNSAMIEALSHTGHAIVFSSLMLLLGFACMLFSPLKTVFLFGGLCIVIILLALVSQILLFGFLQQWIVGERT